MRLDNFISSLSCSWENMQALVQYNHTEHGIIGGYDLDGPYCFDCIDEIRLEVFCIDEKYADVISIKLGFSEKHFNYIVSSVTSEVYGVLMEFDSPYIYSIKNHPHHYTDFIARLIHTNKVCFALECFDESIMVDILHKTIGHTDFRVKSIEKTLHGYTWSGYSFRYNYKGLYFKGDGRLILDLNKVLSIMIDYKLLPKDSYTSVYSGSPQT